MNKLENYSQNIMQGLQNLGQYYNNLNALYQRAKLGDSGLYLNPFLYDSQLGQYLNPYLNNYNINNNQVTGGSL